MTVQTKTHDTAAVGVVDIGARTGAPTQRPDGQLAVKPGTLTCTWVRADDGALVMQWTGQTPEDARQEMAKAAA
jgi:hypothetical protein